MRELLLLCPCGQGTAVQRQTSQPGQGLHGESTLRDFVNLSGPSNEPQGPRSGDGARRRLRDDPDLARPVSISSGGVRNKPMASFDMKFLISPRYARAPATIRS